MHGYLLPLIVLVVLWKVLGSTLNPVMLHATSTYVPGAGFVKLSIQTLNYLFSMSSNVIELPS